MTSDLNNKVTCNEQDGDDDEVDYPQPSPLFTLSECQGSMKRIINFALAQNDFDLLAEGAKCWKKLENKNLANANENSHQTFCSYLLYYFVFHFI